MRACCLALTLLCAAIASAQTKRVLYLTHSAGYRHDSIDVSKRVLAELAAKSGKLEVVSTEDLSAISESALRQFDAVFFFTSGELALSSDQKAALLAFIRGGKGFGGVHSATDTLYTWPEYGELIGGYFDGHPWVQEVTVDVEDPDNPFTKHLASSFKVIEEIYQFRAFSRERVRVLMTLDTGSVDLRAAGVNRTDEDFALAWIRPYGNGRVFYTALGHFDGTWLDPRFQTMFLNALLWITAQNEAEAAPRRSSAAVTAVSTLPSGFDETLAPGSLFTINGSGLTTGSSLAAAALPLPTKLAGTWVRINGKTAPLFEASPNRILAQAPYDLLTPAELVVITGGIDRSSTRTVKVVAAAPRVVAVAADRSTGVAVIYATGLGTVASDVPPGTAAPLDRLVRTVREPMVRIGGMPARVLFSGLAPGLAGVYQVNVEWPAQAPPDAEVVIEAAP
jgi:uncharacterized protein (TIGR03437 family)